MTGSQLLASFKTGFRMEVYEDHEWKGTVTWNSYLENEYWNFLKTSELLTFYVYDGNTGVMYLKSNNLSSYESYINGLIDALLSSASTEKDRLFMKENINSILLLLLLAFSCEKTEKE